GIIYAICRGFIDSLKGGVLLFYIDKQIKEKLIRKSTTKADLRKRDPSAQSSSKHNNQPCESMVLMRTMQCCMLNGGVFLVSIIIFDYGLLPLVKYLLTIIFGHSPGMDLAVWSWIQPFLSLTFSTIWVLPLFLLSRIVNSLWFQDIADSAYRYRQGRPLLLSSVSKLIADTLFSILVQALFLGQGMLVSNVPLPPLGDILALVHMCLLYALYAFEYKCGCVFSILFPLFIVSGNEAEPVTGVCDYQLRLFSPVIAIANTLFNKTIGRAGRR
ncbi:hypothetical protein DMN91_002312, partial [Ooceraea biroi]